jgi:hypothetical protein
VVRLLTAAVCVAALAALAASASAPAATAVCRMFGARWERSDTPRPVHGTLYDVGYTKVSCQFAAAWARKVSFAIAKPGANEPGGPAGFRCRNLGDTRGPANVGGTVIIGSCSDSPAGEFFAWKAHGY